MNVISPFKKKGKEINKGKKTKPAKINMICSNKEIFLMFFLPIKQNKNPIINDIINKIAYELKFKLK